MNASELVEMIETGGCAGLDVAIMEALGLKYNGEVLDSLDAAVALVERVRPNDLWAVGKAVDHYSCHIATGETVLHGYAPTPAAALVAALLRAGE